MSLVCEGCFYTGGRGTPSYYFTQHFASSFMLVGRGWGSFVLVTFSAFPTFSFSSSAVTPMASALRCVFHTSPQMLYIKILNFKFQNCSPCRTARRPSLCPPWSAWWNPENNKNTHFDKYLLENTFLDLDARKAKLCTLVCAQTSKKKM